MHRSVDSVAIRHGVGGTTVALRQERPRGGQAPAS
jgi:hypothetical protein